MRYATGSAFRMALEDRLLRQSLTAGVPLVRLRKTVAFDRLLARMVRTGPDAWILKGGLALQLLIEDNLAPRTWTIQIARRPTTGLA